MKDSERTTERAAAASDGDQGRIQELEKEVLDLKISDKSKDLFVELLEKSAKLSPASDGNMLKN